MKKHTLTFLLFSLTAHATNGVNLTSSTVRGLGVAGNGISHLYSTGDGLLKNPATLRFEGQEFEAGLINLLPDVKTRDKVQNTSYKQSSVQYVPIPTIAYGSNYKKLSYGLGVIPMSGLSSNYKNEKNVYELAPQLSVVTLPIGASKKIGNTSIGASFFPAIGAAAINSSKTPGSKSQSKRKPNFDTSFGYAIGVHQELGPSIELGLAYKSPTKFNFKKQTDLESYVGVSGTGLDDLTLEMPSEVGAGLTLKHELGLFSLEGKNILWSQAKGFRDYGWEDQSVFSLSWLKGFGRFIASAGYSYSTPVFRSKSGEDGTKSRKIEDASLTQQNVSYFNVVGYPAILKHHYAVGLSYLLSPEYSLNSSILYCPPETIERSGTGYTGQYHYETKISLAFINIGLTRIW